MKFVLFTVMTFMLCSCSKSHQVKSSQSVEDQVLIEFAARMEEDYHRFHPGVKDLGASYPEAHSQTVTPILQQTPSEAKPVTPQDAQ